MLANLLSYLDLIFFILLGIQTVYSFLFALASHIPYRLKKQNEKDFRISILIPSYKEDKIILSTTRDALDLDYPKDKFRVIVGADQMLAETNNKLREMGAEVVEMNFEHSTKSKNLLAQVESQFGDKWPDYFLILDSDNRMDANGLQETNAIINSDIPVYQLHRTAKNDNTNLAILDGITEAISNNIFRKGHRNLGLSSGLVGSGMLFKAEVLQETLQAINRDSAVEDKLFEFYLLEQKYFIEYVKQVPVYDEKVSSGKNFSNQRKRWIAGQIHAFKLFIIPGFKQLFKGNLGFFDKALQMAFVPKLLFAILLGLLSVAAWLFDFGHNWWYYQFGLYALTLFICIPGSYFKWSNLPILWELPKAAFFMLLAIARIKKNQSVKEFEHTEKEFIEEK